MSKLLGKSEAIDLSSAEVQVLTPAEKGVSSARMIWEEMLPKGADLSEMADRLREMNLEPDEHNYVLAGLMQLSRKSVDQFLRATEFHDTEVLAEMNRVLDERHGMDFSQPKAEPDTKEARKSNKRLKAVDQDLSEEAEDDVA